MHKITTVVQETETPRRYVAREKVHLSEQIHENPVDDNSFSPFSEFLSVRQEANTGEADHDGYSHQP